MTKRESIFSLLVVGGLLITIISLFGPASFDCRQSLLTSVSSCSIVGGSCINEVNKAGFTGLIDFLNIGPMEPIEISCMPGCTIRIGDHLHPAELDSVSHRQNIVP